MMKCVMVLCVFDSFPGFASSYFSFRALLKHLLGVFFSPRVS